MEKDDVKSWLRAIKKDRFWLADQLGVSKLGIDGWLSRTRPIPKSALRLLPRLMERYPVAVTKEQANSETAMRSISSPCTQEQKEKIQAASSKIGESEEAFVLTAALSRAEMIC